MEHFSENCANLGVDFSLNDLAKKCAYDLSVDSLKIRPYLERILAKYHANLQSTLNATPKHLEAEQNAFLKHKVELKYGAQSKATLESTLTTIKQYNADFDTAFYKGESLKQMPPKSLCKNAMDSWDKLFESKIHAWQQQYIAESKSAFVSQISEWIELIKQFHKRIKAFGKGGGLFGESIMQHLRESMEDSMQFGDSSDSQDSGDFGNSNDLDDAQDLIDSRENDLDNVGDSMDLQDLGDSFNRFADKSNANLRKNIANLTKWLKVLERDSVKKLCDMLGSLYKAESEMQLERFALSEDFSTAIPTPFAKEEISGVTLGRDLENVLPQELALLDDEDFSILFDLKFAENRLFCFEKSGYENEGESQKAQDKGAMILCVDTSGSMRGTPEVIAKAIALFMAQRAMEANRKCYLINFSVGISELDLSAPNGFFELMRFLEMSFYGGTDALPALKAGLTKMRDEGYKNADLLMISDFEFDSRDLAEIEDLATQKDDNNKCYALYIGDFARKARDSRLFHKEFYFNGDTNKVVEFCSTL